MMLTITSTSIIATIISIVGLIITDSITIINNNNILNLNSVNVVVVIVVNNSIKIAISIIPMSIVTLAVPITFLASRRRLMPC